MIDTIGHPITKGCTVLTSAHYSSTVDTIATVKKATKVSVVVEIRAGRWDRTKKNTFIL